MRYVTIETVDRKSKGLDLRAILLAIWDQVPNVIWSLQIIEGVGDVTGVVGMTMVELERRCDPHDGLIVSRQQLVALSDACEDIIELLLLGCAPTRKIPRAYADDDWERECEIVISYEDSSMWELYAREPEVMARLESLGTGK